MIRWTGTGRSGGKSEVGVYHTDLINKGGNNLGNIAVLAVLHQVNLIKPMLTTLAQLKISMVITVGRMAGISTCQIL